MGNLCCGLVDDVSTLNGDLALSPQKGKPKFVPANNVWHGYLGLDILPSIIEFLKSAVLRSFLEQMYLRETKDNVGTSWSSVSYCPPGEPHLATMNVAMPDHSAEYWTTFIQADSAPIFKIDFPRDAVYAALTLYDTSGMPVSSINSRQVDAFLEHSERQQLGDTVQLHNGEVFVNLMGKVDVKGPTCVLFRVYKCAGMKMTPDENMPVAFTVSRDEASKFTPEEFAMSALRREEVDSSLERGRKIGANFAKLIGKNLKKLKKNQVGTQFFHPSSVAGLFVNANATYVVAFMKKNQRGMRMKATVPTQAKFRCYYGVMAVDYTSTMTLASLTHTELGGWGSEFEVFAARTEQDAIVGGYDKANDKMKLLLWGKQCKGPLGICLRYLHHFEPVGYMGEEEDLAKAQEERLALCKRNGDLQENLGDKIEGVGNITFF